MSRMPELPPEANVTIAGHFAYVTYRADYSRASHDWDAYYDLSTPAGRAALASYVVYVLNQIILDFDKAFPLAVRHEWSEAWDGAHDFLWAWRDEWLRYGNLPATPELCFE